MYIGYKNQKLKKTCTEINQALKILPSTIKPKRLFNRLRDLNGFESMADIPTIPPYRLHKWKGKRKGQWTIDIQGLFRIHFIPVGDYTEDSEKNPILKTVTSIEIVDIGDFHGW